jgi:AcrR family transcriptional regulator
MDNAMTVSMVEGPGSDSQERILRAATSLFAAHGYHGVSTRAIAQAAGLNISTLNYHTGGKRKLYRALFHRLFQQEYEIVARFAGYVDDDVVCDRTALRGLIEQMVDALVDMTVASPEVPRLWVWRWLEREFRFEDIEVNFSLPLFEMVRDLLERGRQAGTIRAPEPDLRLLLISFTWMLYGYFTGGPIAWNQAQAYPLDPDQVAAFKVYLHDYIARMLGL